MIAVIYMLLIVLVPLVLVVIGIGMAHAVAEKKKEEDHEDSHDSGHHWHMPEGWEYKEKNWGKKLVDAQVVDQDKNLLYRRIEPKYVRNHMGRIVRDANGKKLIEFQQTNDLWREIKDTKGNVVSLEDEKGKRIDPNSKFAKERLVKLTAKHPKDGNGGAHYVGNYIVHGAQELVGNLEKESASQGPIGREKTFAAMDSLGHMGEAIFGYMSALFSWLPHFHKHEPHQHFGAHGHGASHGTQHGKGPSPPVKGTYQQPLSPPAQSSPSSQAPPLQLSHTFTGSGRPQGMQRPARAPYQVRNTYVVDVDNNYVHILDLKNNTESILTADKQTIAELRQAQNEGRLYEMLDSKQNDLLGVADINIATGKIISTANGIVGIDPDKLQPSLARKYFAGQGDELRNEIYADLSVAAHHATHATFNPGIRAKADAKYKSLLEDAESKLPEAIEAYRRIGDTQKAEELAGIYVRVRKGLGRDKSESLPAEMLYGPDKQWTMKDSSATISDAQVRANRKAEFRNNRKYVTEPVVIAGLLPERTETKAAEREYLPERPEDALAYVDDQIDTLEFSSDKKTESVLSRLRKKFGEKNDNNTREQKSVVLIPEVGSKNLVESPESYVPKESHTSLKKTISNWVERHKDNLLSEEKTLKKYAEFTLVKIDGVPVDTTGKPLKPRYSPEIEQLKKETDSAHTIYDQQKEAAHLRLSEADRILESNKLRRLRDAKESAATRAENLYQTSVRAYRLGENADLTANTERPSLLTFGPYRQEQKERAQQATSIADRAYETAMTAATEALETYRKFGVGLSREEVQTLRSIVQVAQERNYKEKGGKK